mmetsp:Transcript_10091/g.29801  ORF Transcript_10091/g.29801 Transcript_10091/m.29801 type:complete len:357 (-) Transcript_10091:77-1147(-)
MRWPHDGPRALARVPPRPLALPVFRRASFWRLGQAAAAEGEDGTHSPSAWPASGDRPLSSPPALAGVEHARAGAPSGRAPLDRPPPPLLLARHPSPPRPSRPHGGCAGPARRAPPRALLVPHSSFPRRAPHPRAGLRRLCKPRISKSPGNVTSQLPCARPPRWRRRWQRRSEGPPRRSPCCCGDTAAGTATAAATTPPSPGAGGPTSSPPPTATADERAPIRAPPASPSPRPTTPADAALGGRCRSPRWRAARVRRSATPPALALALPLLLFAATQVGAIQRRATGHARSPPAPVPVLLALPFSAARAAGDGGRGCLGHHARSASALPSQCQRIAATPPPRQRGHRASTPPPPPRT